MGNMLIKMLFMLTRLQKSLDLFHSFANLSHVWLNGRQLGSCGRFCRLLQCHTDHAAAGKLQGECEGGRHSMSWC